MKKLSVNNQFFNWMDTIGDVIILNILFVVTSLPVITLGMSLTALYKVALRYTRKESVHVAKEYIAACKEEWKRGTVLWFIFLIAGGLLFFDFFYMAGRWKLFGAAVGCLMLIWAILFTYVFPLQARFENTLGNIFKNAAALSIRNLPYTIIMICINAIPVLCIMAGPFVTMMAMPVYLLAGFGLTAVINSFFLNKIFGSFIDQEGRGHENSGR